MSDTAGARLFGRSTELALLRRQLDAVVESGRGRILALRGRRQVGKSTVVEHFVQAAGRPSVFVTGVFGAPLRQQLARATEAVAESHHPLPDAALLWATPPPTWHDWLGRIALAARGGPIVVVLDEFPWLAAGDPTLEGELQAAWDRVLERSPVLLILIGSAVAMMERLADHDRPLFGRLQPVVVPALNPAEVAAALPGRPAFQAFDAYLVTGGYPRLVLALAAHQGTPAEFVRASFQDACSPLVTTARLTLDAEFPDPTAAARVLAAIGANDTARPGFTDVLSAIADPAERKKAETAVTRALASLTGAGLIERETPAWSGPESRLRRYRVTDPYLRFWFRYVERGVDAISRGRPDLALAHFDRDWTSWRGRSVEPVVRRALVGLAAVDRRLPDVEDVRPWWTRDGSVEVDVVASTASATTLVGSIKWRPDGAVTTRELDELRQHRDRVPRAADARLGVVVPSGRAPAGADAVFSADDLLGGWR